MDALINKIREKIVGKTESSGPEYLLMGKSYPPIALDVKNFHPIIPYASPDPSSILFVDGGNTLLFQGAGFAIGVLRVAGVIYKNNQRIAREQIEWYIIASEQGDELLVETVPETIFNGLRFNAEDETLRNGTERADCSRIIPIVRRFAELDYAQSLSKKYSPDIILLDGTLEARYANESQHLRQLLSCGNVCALSKTCSLATNRGVPITKQLFDMHDHSWFYHPIVRNQRKDHPAEIYFAKFHDASSHVFRFEIQQGFSGTINGLFGLLKQNSIDLIFRGYPYGLIDVDGMARISEEEKKMLQTKISVKLGKQWNEFSKHLDSMNAHEILDKIKF